jgi:peptide-methionine (S)-S-oxide reductase
MLKGVSDVRPGYAGGETKNPTYEQVSGGGTGHAEVIRIEYDPSLVSYETLLTIFFASHDPTTVNRQGNDVGTQYRSIILYTSAEQKERAEKFINNANSSSEHGAKIVTEVEPLNEFYEAEDYHKNYYESNKYQPYCQVVINPKLEKIQKHFAELLNKEYKV